MATYNPSQLGISAPSGGFQTGGWYSGRQFWGGTLGEPGEFHPSNNQSGQQGQAYVAPENQAYIEQQREISANQITAPVNLNLPTQTSSGISSELEAARALLEQNLSDRTSKNQQELEKARQLEQKTLEEAKPLTEPFRQELETQKRAEYGTEGVIGEQKALLDELDQLLTEGNDLIRQQQQVTGIAAIRNPRIQQTMENVAARAGVINAVVNLQNTYLANAYQSIDRSIANITADRQDRLNYYNTILSLANRDIIELTQESRNIAEKQTSLLEFDLQNAQESVNMIKKLMIDPSTALLMTQAGVSLNDSVEIINAKMARAQYSNEVRDASNSITSAGGIAIADPSSVPEDQLVSFTDSQNQVHYYKIPKSGSGGFDPTSFLADLQNLGVDVQGAGIDQLSGVNVNAIWDEVLINSFGTYAGAPAFSPSGGVGTLWTDSSGIKWIYTASGWRKSNN